MKKITSLLLVSCFVSCLSLFLVAEEKAAPPAPTTPTTQPAQKTEWTEPYFFIQMADPQLKFGEGALTEAKIKKVVAGFARAIEAANALKPAFVTICGDLIDKNGDDEHAKIFKDVVAKLDKTIPLYLVAGNHDIRAKPKSVAWYRKTYDAEPWYSFECKAVKYIVISGTIARSGKRSEGLAEAQMKWYKQELETLKEGGYQHAVLLHHEPFFTHKATKDPEGKFEAEPGMEAYLTLTLASPIRLALAGHTHQNHIFRHEGLEMVTTAHASFKGGGFRIVKVFEDHIEHEYVEMKKIPDSVDMTPKKIPEPETQPAKTSE